MPSVPALCAEAHGNGVAASLTRCPAFPKQSMPSPSPPGTPSLLSSLTNFVSVVVCLCFGLVVPVVLVVDLLGPPRSCGVIGGGRGGGQVNGVLTPTLDAFLDVVKYIGDKSPARVKTVSKRSAVGRSKPSVVPTLVHGVMLLLIVWCGSGLGIFVCIGM